MRGQGIGSEKSGPRDPSSGNRKHLRLIDMGGVVAASWMKKNSIYCPTRKFYGLKYYEVSETRPDAGSSSTHRHELKNEIHQVFV